LNQEEQGTREDRRQLEVHDKILMHNKFPEASSVGFDWEGILQSVFL
jgi:hypothetical protein